MYLPYTSVTHGSAGPAIAVPGWLSRLMRLCLVAAGGFCFWLLLDAPAHATDGGPDRSSDVDTAVTRSVGTVTRAADGLPPGPVEAPLPAPPMPDASLEETGGPSDGWDGRLDGTVRDAKSAVPSTSLTGSASGTPSAALDAVPGDPIPDHLAPGRVVPTGRTGGTLCGQAPAVERVTAEALRLLSADRHSDPPAPRPGPCTPQATVMPTTGNPGSYDSKGVLSDVPAVTDASGSSPAAALLDGIRNGSAKPPVSPD